MLNPIPQNLSCRDSSIRVFILVPSRYYLWTGSWNLACRYTLEILGASFSQSSLSKPGRFVKRFGFQDLFYCVIAFEKSCILALDILFRTHINTILYYKPFHVKITENWLPWEEDYMLIILSNCCILWFDWIRELPQIVLQCTADCLYTIYLV